MEALVRWLKPGSGCIPPLDFIPLAEETGLILPIGEFVLRTACAQNKAWQNAGYPPFRISVNLSARQFQQHNLPKIVEDILQETGLNPKWLSIEITESIAMQDLNLAVKMIEKLKEIGIEVSLDDFGTGYSSLNYLKKLPIDVLKIDKSFVRDISEECDELKIIKAVIMLAHSMNLKVVAEGVETHEQLKFLKGHSCDRAQGYLFSKPLPPAELENLLKNSTPF
jgi:EAL domain-containing protein (putative c-di-GMP-specific phosphodiesterase class I)